MGGKRELAESRKNAIVLWADSRALVSLAAALLRGNDQSSTDEVWRLPMHRLILSSVILILAIGWLRGDEETTDKKAQNLRELSHEVNALQVLYQLQMTKKQMVALKEMARDTADRSRIGKDAKDDTKLRKALVDLRAALIEAKDADKIVDLAESLDELQRLAKVEFNEDTEITEEARAEAPKLLKLLTAKQVASYAGVLADEINDPTERLQEALAKSRNLDDKEWKEFRAEISEEIGRLLGGVDPDKAEEFGNKAVQLLIVARSMTAEEFKTGKADLEKKVKALAGNLGPTDVVRNVMEFHFAELLSNPQLLAALEAKLK
jgi:hypothetical protein